MGFKHPDLPGFVSEKKAAEILGIAQGGGTRRYLIGQGVRTFNALPNGKLNHLLYMVADLYNLKERRAKLAAKAAEPKPKKQKPLLRIPEPTAEMASAANVRAVLAALHDVRKEFRSTLDRIETAQAAFAADLDAIKRAIVGTAGHPELTAGATDKIGPAEPGGIDYSRDFPGR